MPDSIPKYILLEEYLPDPEDRRMYMENAYFRQGLDTFLAAIPIFIEGLRSVAERENKRLLALQHKLRYPDGWNDT